MAFIERYNSEADEFWGKTDKLLEELEALQRETQAISCPCQDPDCPFRSKNGTTSLHRNRVMESHNSIRIRRSGTYDGFSNGNVMSPERKKDCEVATEGEDPFDDSYEFKRNTIFRRPRRKPLQGFKSYPLYPVTRTRLSLPRVPIYTPSGRSMSLPSSSFSFPCGEFERLPQNGLSASW